MIDEKLNRDSSVPLYIQLSEIIRSHINRGVYLPGARLPSEQEFMNIFDISRITVRQAINDLKSKGIVIQRQGVGTFVRENVFIQAMDDIVGFYPALIKKGIMPKINTLEYQFATPNPTIQTLLEIDKDQTILKFTRSYEIDERVFVVCQMHMPEYIAKHWTKEEAAKKNSLALIKENANIQLVHSKINIKASLATEKIAKYLNIVKGAPTLELGRLTFSVTGPVDYTILSFKGESYELTSTVPIGEMNNFKVRGIDINR